MELGLVGDISENGYRQQNWFPGTPKRSFWTGLKVKKDQVVPVVTLRCPMCGYLESYATRQTISKS
jgi:hypothetical protein